MSTTTHQGAVGAEAMTAGLLKRMRAASGSEEEGGDCSCNVAGGSDAWQLHDPLCAYRLICEAADALEATPAPRTDGGMTAGEVPRIFKDGDAWCCLLGDNLQDGIAGFGNTPDAALRQFRKRLTGNLCSVLRGGLKVADDALREIARDVAGADWLLEQEAEGRGPLATIKAVLDLHPAGQSTGQGAKCPECFGSGLRDIDGTSDDKCAACDGSGALAARPAAPEAQGAWSFDMEAAPQDGTRILLWRQGCWIHPVIGYRAPSAPGSQRDCWREHGSRARIHRVDCWQPIPAPPSSGQGGR
ncbi:hypothetical protein ABEV34_28595 [Methylorubrum rhodesianum]|uniref:hypothetical protein n=1 Tax=Methylorubrum rhodesianum TaxID=29427 RepID=UPI00161E693A|nr:hypothetical protein [Methylorubrum rhodesianum]MBB5764640.1 hypothetical protein [Methylorubrum rhodesianum]